MAKRDYSLYNIYPSDDPNSSTYAEKAANIQEIQTLIQQHNNDFLKNRQNEDNSYRQHFETISQAEWGWLAGILEGEGSYQEHNRTRTKDQLANYEKYYYKPAPPGILIKLEMVDPFVVLQTAKYFVATVNEGNRTTNGQNKTYKTVVEDRNKVKLLLNYLVKYTVGKATLAEINRLLKNCEEHDQWLADDGPSKQASMAAKIGAEKRKARKSAPKD